MVTRLTTAKASLISNRSTSSRLQPVLLISLRIAPTGATGNSPGSSANAACPWITAKGLRPRLSASDSRISNNAAAPSEIELELAAVTVPPSRNAGLRLAILSSLAFGGCSSWRMVFCSLPTVTCTGTISLAKLPWVMASCARVREAMANASWASRVKPLCSAQSSAKVPIRRPLS